MTTIRLATSEDAQAIAQVHIHSRREAMPWLAEVHSEAETVWWVENIVLPNQRVWVAECDGIVVAIAALDGSVLEQLYVLPGCQGRGIGKTLLDTAIQESPGALELWTFQRNAPARAFYERHGFTAVEFTDGASNEEHEPDVRYVLTSAKPILFVDIDGVLNMYGGPCPSGYEEHHVFPQDDEPVRINPQAEAMLADLSSTYDLMWGSGWSAEDREVLPLILRLPHFVGAAEMPPIPFDPVEKIPAIEQAAGNRPLAWIDDLHTTEGVAWAESRRAPTLLVHTDPAVGMTREHVTILLDWAKTLV